LIYNYGVKINKNIKDGKFIMEGDATKIRNMIERALADGVLSRAESEMIKSAINADKKVSKEETHLWTELQNKIWTGEVVIN
jgi:uncharacterized membrane protein YebE (DUF533 family)